MKLKYVLLTLVIGHLASLQAIAAGTLTIAGKIWSTTATDYVIRTQKNLIYIKKSAVPESDRKQFEVPNGSVAIDVSPRAIEKMKPIPRDR